MMDFTKLFSFLIITYIAAIIVVTENYPKITYIIDALLIGLFIFYMISKDQNLKINPLIIAYTLFTTFALASSLWAFSFDFASFTSLKLLLIIINLIVLYNLMINFDLKTSFMNGILLGSFVNYVLVIGLITVPFDVFIGSRYVGTTGNANSLAILMMTSIFISIIYLIDDKSKKDWHHYYQYINILFAIYMILLTASKKGIIFGSVLLLFYMLISLKSKKGLGRIVLLGMLASIILFFFVDVDQIIFQLEGAARRFSAFSDQFSSGEKFGSTGQRKAFIELGLVVLQDKPLFGYGINNFRVLSEGGFYSHNNYIELMVGVGLVGFSFFYYIYIYLLNLVYKMPKSDLKKLFLIFILILLSMDMALVSYGSKLRIYVLLFLSVYMVQNIKSKGHEI